MTISGTSIRVRFIVTLGLSDTRSYNVTLHSSLARSVDARPRFSSKRPGRSELQHSTVAVSIAVLFRDRGNEKWTQNLTCALRSAFVAIDVAFLSSRIFIRVCKGTACSSRSQFPDFSETPVPYRKMENDSFGLPIPQSSMKIPHDETGETRREICARENRKTRDASPLRLTARNRSRGISDSLWPFHIGYRARF